MLRCDECPCTFKKVGSLNAHVSRVHTKMTVFTDDKQPLAASKEDEDLLFKALNSTGLPSNTPVKKREMHGKVVILDKGNNKKHFVGISKASDGSKLYLCNFCTKDFKRPSDLIRHIRIHNQDQPFKCRFCPRAFAIKSTLNSHLKIHNESSRHHACTVCFKQFDSIKTLKEHQKDHVVVNDINMEPLILTDQGLVKTDHRFKSVYFPTRNEALQRKHRCNSCTASFKKSSHLKQHVLSVHSRLKPFKCDVCDKNFVTRGSLNGHLRTHTMDQAFQCSICPMVFTTKGSARRHMSSSHKVERLYVCPICRKTFKTNVLCKKHMKIHRKDVIDNASTLLPAQASMAPPSQEDDVLNTIETKDLTSRDMNLFAAPQEELLGTITLQQGDQLANVDLSNIQITSDFVLKTEPKLCLDCNEVMLDDHQCFATKKKDQFFCSYKKCGSDFESTELLAEHMMQMHQPPFTPKPKIRPLEPPVPKVVKFDEVEESISEKLLRDSLKEKDRISSVKTKADIRSDHPNKCDVCTMSFKKPSDLLRHKRTHTGEVRN